MKFSHLHVHTQFSLLDGAANIQAAKALKPGIDEEFARYGLKAEFKPAN